MICKKCAKDKYKFLLAYKDPNVLFKPEEILAFLQNIENTEEPKIKTDKGETGEEVLGKRTRNEESRCKIKDLLTDTINNMEYDQPIFLKEEWQDNLCLCHDC